MKNVNEMIDKIRHETIDEIYFPVYTLSKWEVFNMTTGNITGGIVLGLFDGIVFFLYDVC